MRLLMRYGVYIYKIHFSHPISAYLLQILIGLDDRDTNGANSESHSMAIVGDPLNQISFSSSASGDHQPSPPTHENNQSNLASVSAPLPSPAQPVRTSSLFQKASGGKVHISDAARNRATQFFSTTSNEATATSNPANFTSASSSSSIARAPVPAVSSSSSSRTSSLLQKASGRSVVISDTAQQRAQQWLASTENNNPVPVPASQQPRLLQSIQAQQSAPRTSSLLTKASGKAVVISDEARAKAAQLMQGMNSHSTSGTTSEAPMLPPMPVVTPKTSSLLQRANGKSVVISDEARQKAKSMLQSASSYSSSSALTTPVAPGHAMVTPAHPNRILPSSNNGMSSTSSSKQNYATMETPTTAQSSSSASLSSSAAVVTVDRNNNTFTSSPNHYHTATAAAGDAVQSLIMPPQQQPIARRLQFPTPDLTRQSLLTEPISLDSMQHVEMTNHLKKRLQILNKTTSSNVLVNIEQVGVQPKDILQQVKASYHGNISSFIDFQLLWIPWTLTSYERRQPEVYLGQLVNQETLDTVLRSRCEQFLVFDKDQQVKQQQSKNNRSPHKMIGKTHISSLQRSSEIMLLEHPLCVCVMLSLSIRGVDSLSNAANNLLENSIVVTDGWFQIEAKLDPTATELVRTNKIRDGTKLCIFTAQFVSEANDSKVFIALSMNGIRRANTHTKLGILPTSSLSRGLSVHSLAINGGSIYAVQGTILKFITRYQVNGPQSEKGLKAKKPLLMTEREAQEYMEHVEKQLQQQAAVHEQRLQMANNEDDIEQEQDELDDLMQTAQQFTVQKQIDMLVRCSISCVLAWIRLPAAAESEEGEMDLSNAIGRTVLITNLVISKRSQSKLMQLIATRSSTWRVLQSKSVNGQQLDSSSNQAVIIDDGSSDTKINLRNPAFLGYELTKQLYLIDITMIINAEASSSNGKRGLAIHEQASVQLFAIDDNYLCYRLGFECYSALVHRYMKLQVGSSLMVEFAAIGTYDNVLDVLQLHQNDRTVIQISSSLSASSYRSKVTAAVTAAKPAGIVLKCQEEQSRVKALQTLQSSFLSVALPFIHFDCRRLLIDKVSLFPSTVYVLKNGSSNVYVTPVKLTMIVEEHSQLNRELQTSLPWLFNEDTFCMELVNAAVLHFGSEAPPQFESSLQSILLQQITSYDANGGDNLSLQVHCREEVKEEQSHTHEEVNVNECLQSLSFVILLISNH